MERSYFFTENLTQASPLTHKHATLSQKLAGKNKILFLTHHHDASPSILSLIPETHQSLPFLLLSRLPTTHLLHSKSPPLHFFFHITKQLMTIRRTTRSLSPAPIMAKTTSPPHAPKPPSPVNVSHFPTEGWMLHTRPTVCVVPGWIRTIIGYEVYYIHAKCVLCTRAFSVAAVTTTVNDCASPSRSTELDDDTGHNCKMSRELYNSFARLVLGLNHDTWALHRTECAFRNLIVQDLDAIMY